MSEKNCKVCNALKSSGITLYNAPKEEYRRKEWSAACGVTITKTSLVCQNHFSEKDFCGKRKNLKVDALPTENVKETEATRTSESTPIQVKTEPPEFVVVTSSNSISLASDPSTITNVSIKEELIDEDCFDEHTDNPISTTQNGNNTMHFDELKNKVLICGHIYMEIEENGAHNYGLVCSYCKSAIPILDQNFWQKFITHLTNSHDSKIQPLEESDNIAPVSSNSEAQQKRAVANEEANLQKPTNPTETYTEKHNDIESNASRNANDLQYAQSSEDDYDSSDETYEPTPKKSKKAGNNTKTQVAESNKKTKELISFDHSNKNCVIAFLELLKDNSILWLPRQSIMKRFDEALTDISTKFNERFPEYTLSKEQLRDSIKRIKDLYHRGSDEKQKRRMKAPMYKIKYAEYFELCAAIEENSKNIKQNCNLCQTVFYSSIDMQIHKVKRHQIGELPFKCQRCGYGFTCPEKLSSHEQKHNRVKQFICEFCNEGFYFKSKLQAHLALHTDDGKQICEICGKKFPSPWKYRRHKLHHEAPKEKCEICGKLFYEKWSLSEHMKSHRNERHYKCEICGKEFNRREGLTIHKRGVHKIKTPTKRYVWVDKITNTCDIELQSQNQYSIENEAQNSNSNSSSLSSSTNEQTITEVKPVLPVNPNYPLLPLEILNSFLP